MIGRLFHAPRTSEPTGTATIGSSEAIMLAMLAHKRSWQRRREPAGQPAERPNMVIGADVHTCWEKFARYFEVEPRVVPLEEGRYTIGAEQVEPLLDERTIAVAGLLGTTFTGQIDDLASIDALLARVESERGWRIPLHIDAASGGFIARSPVPTWRGTSASRTCARSTSRTTSSGSSTPAWARSCSATHQTCPRSSSSTSTTSAATCRTTR